MTFNDFLDILSKSKSYDALSIDTVSDRELKNGMNINVYDLEVVNVDYGKKEMYLK